MRFWCCCCFLCLFFGWGGVGVWVGVADVCVARSVRQANPNQSKSPTHPTLGKQNHTKYTPGFYSKRVLHPDHHLLLDARRRALEAFAALGRQAQRSYDQAATADPRVRAKVSIEVLVGEVEVTCEWAAKKEEGLSGCGWVCGA